MAANIYATTGGKPVEGAWYEGRRYMNGQLLAPGEYEPGKVVSAEVAAQTNPNNVSFVNQQRQQQGLTPLPSQNQSQTVTVAAPSGGGSFDMSSFGNQPSPLNLQSLYDKAYNTPEITQANQNAQTKMQEIEGMRRQLAEAEAQINDNPFLSEASRVGRIAKLREKAEQTINNLTGEYQNLAGVVNSLKADAETKFNLGTKQYELDQQAFNDNLSRFSTMLQMGAFDNASGDDIATLSRYTGMSASSIQSIIKKTTAQEVKPQLVQSTDDNGNVTVSVIDLNTGELIKQNSLGKVGNAEKGSGGEKESKTDYISYATQDAKGGVVFKDMLKIYEGYLSPEEIYRIYNLNSRYGPAKEGKKELKQYGITK